MNGFMDQDKILDALSGFSESLIHEQLGASSFIFKIKVSIEKWVVYSHVINGSIFYIGYGSICRAFDFNSRKMKWKNFVEMNGNQFEVKILSSFSSPLEAMIRESILIRHYKPMCNDFYPSLQYIEKLKSLKLNIVSKSTIHTRKNVFNNSLNFIREKVVKDEDKNFAKIDLYIFYTQWCIKSGINPDPQRIFNKNLISHFSTTMIQLGPRRTKSWKGISLICDPKIEVSIPV